MTYKYCIKTVLSVCAATNLMERYCFVTAEDILSVTNILVYHMLMTFLNEYNIGCPKSTEIKIISFLEMF